MSEQPLLLDAPSPRPKTPCEKLKEAHGIKTHWSEHEQDWLALYPKPQHSGMDVSEIMAEECRLYDDTGRLYYGKTEEEAVFGLCVQMYLDTSIILNP